MYQPPIVNFPVFSVKWSEATDADGVTTPAVLAAGGGGSGKTGVGNKISLIAVRAGATAPSHTIAFELETSPDTCCCVAASENGQLVAAAFGKNVQVFLSNPSGFHKMGEVEADFAEKDGGINSMTFSEASSHEATGSARDVVRLATGGEDGILRVWEVGAAKPREEYTRDNRDQQETPSLQVTLAGECKGHSKPITCVVFHPAGDFVLTSSKDGTCRMWDWQRGFEMAILPTASGLPSSVATTTVMCRSCSFSPSKPDAIFTAQSGQRGNAYVTEWKFSQADFRGQENGGQGEGGEKVAVRPVRTKRVSSHPVTSLSVRSDGARLAVANVEGTVIVYRLPGFAKVMEYRAHDLPVTGLGFAPERAGFALGGFNLLAGSADYKITLLKSQGNAASVLAKQILAFMWSIMMLLVTVIFWVVAAIFWLLNVVEAVLFIVIPIAGLVGIGLALFYHPKELLDTVRRILKLGDDGEEGNF